MEKYVIVKDIMRKVPRFNLQGRTVEFKLKPVPQGVEPVGWIKNGISQLVRKATEGLEPQDQVSFSFCSKDFKRGDGWIRFQEASKVTMNDVWDIISSVYQSNSTGVNTETFCLGATSVRLPTGKGNDNRGRKYNNFDEECAMRRGIVTIKNKDNLCLPRALVVAIAHVMKDTNYTKIRKDTGKIQTQKSLRLMEEAAVTIPEEGAGIPELQLFQQYLKEYRIVVHKYGTKGRDVIFSGSGEGITLNLLHHQGHYNVITSLTAAFCCSYYCKDCHVPYDHKDKHSCGGTCQACGQSPACQNQTNVKCDDCYRTFRSSSCFVNHKKVHSGNTVCQKIRLCPDCLKTIKTNRKHVCGEIFCKTCYKHQHRDHLCHMQPDTRKPKAEDILFVFYDLETRQEKCLNDGSLVHEPNLCVFKQCCDMCIDTEQEICQKCGVRLQIVRCNDPTEPFLHHLLTLRKKFKNVVVLAHNGQAFDHQFILNHVLTKTDLKPELIMRGTKIVMMQLENVKFLDSLNYFPMALSALPKAFGLGDSLKKGYFPHLFNTSENKDYVGPMPSIEFYDADNMKENDRTAFLKWYDLHKKDTFDMQRDIVEYCKSDVTILTQACLKFRKQMLETANVCPFTEACTIASTCNKVFRRNFLQSDTIGIIPKNGYRWRDNQSRIAIQWLMWEEKQRGVNIVCAAKGKEASIGGVKVDGYCPETEQVFEFHGCYYHGCPVCFKYERDAPLHDNPVETLNTRYESTTAKVSRLRERGHEVIEKWECLFRNEKNINYDIESYTLNHPALAHTPLNPRDAFYGGRTGNTNTYYKGREGEKIKYVDVCSLYPWVCKYGKFPIGHPQVIVGEEECSKQELSAIEGIIKCKVLPPQDLYHPVLPLKMNNKLMFILCRTCGEDMNQLECNHSEEQRALSGTWIIDELRKAIEVGYRLITIFEIWHYNMVQYDKFKNIDGLFTAMMNKFIKLKQQASGWPKTCTTEEGRRKYIEEFFHRENVLLEFNEICENPGLRSLAKLMLNSFWGKLGQRENQTKTAIVRTPEEFFGMLTNPSIVVEHALPINEDALIVNWTYKEETYDPLFTVNVCLAAYTTAQARLKLYSYLEQLGDRVLYYDTDSVIFTHKDGQYEPPTGEFIGDLTDELEAYGVKSYITEFVSGGPKNYAYKIFSTATQTEQVVCKVKGISLNYNVSQKVNFESIRDMILKDEDTEPIKIVSRQIRRTNEHDVITREEIKMYRPNSTKRKFLSNYDSVPYGFKKQKTE